MRMLAGTLAVLAAVAVVAWGCGGGGAGGDPPLGPTYRLSGTVMVASGTVVDSDVNDSLAVYLANDSLQVAQEIPNPCVVGGYVNVPGRGPPGRSAAAGDVSDMFRVSLVAGQSLTLVMGDPVAGDLDLFLRDRDGNVVDSSQGVGRTETLTVATAGTYYVEVMAFAGATTYTLAVGGPVPPATSPLRLSDEFVPGDVVIRFKDSAQAVSKVAAETLEARAASVGLEPAAGGPGRAMLLRVGSRTGGPARSAGRRADPAQAYGPAAMSALDPEFEAKQETLRIIKALRQRPDVLYAEPNYLAQGAAIATDPFYGRQWSHPMINLPQAWDITEGSSEVIVAVLDTGVLLDHPDLREKLAPGYDFVSDPASALDGTGIDPDPADPGTSGAGSLPSPFHGSHVAGIVAAAIDNGVGIAGVAPKVRIMPVRVMGLGTRGTFHDIAQGVRFAAGLTNDSGTLPAQRADVINLSLAGAVAGQELEEACSAARNEGVIVVAAAGNGNSAAPSYPAAYPGVVSVSGVDIQRLRAPYSNFGTTIDVAAPGGDLSKDVNGDGFPDGVLSTVGDDLGPVLTFVWRILAGTSQAAAHVSGVAALMKSVYPALTPTVFDQLLAAGDLTEDPGAPGRDDLFGYGLIDARRAAARAAELAQLPVDLTPVLSVVPSSVNFGAVATSATIFAGNAGGGSLAVSAVSDDAAWLTVSAGSAGADGLGSYGLMVDRTGLGAGTYTATVTFASGANTVRLSVIMQVATAGVVFGAGHHFVRLLDTATGAVVAQVSAVPSDGQYVFSIGGVPAGSYQLVAGTDFDNDGFICDAGDACGAYPTLDQPGDLDVGGDLSGLDFPTAILVQLVAASAGTTRRPIGAGSPPMPSAATGRGSPGGRRGRAVRPVERRQRFGHAGGAGRVGLRRPGGGAGAGRAERGGESQPPRRDPRRPGGGGRGALGPAGRLSGRGAGLRPGALRLCPGPDRRGDPTRQPVRRDLPRVGARGAHGGVPAWIAQEARRRLDDRMRGVVDAFSPRFPSTEGPPSAGWQGDAT